MITLQTGLHIAIDLGTTNITCTILEFDELGQLTKRRLKIRQLINCPSRTDAYGFLDRLPTTVWINDNKILCGQYCKIHIDKLVAVEGSIVVDSIKNHIGNNKWMIEVNGKEIKAVNIYFFLLKVIEESLRIDLEGENKNWEQIEIITITIPASFSSIMRHNTLLSAKAVWNDISINLIDEPIASIFSDWDFSKKAFKRIIRDEPILIIDPGGGTTDVSVVKITSNNEVFVLGSSRYNNFAGWDLDLEIAAFLLNHMSKENTGFNLEENVNRSNMLALIREAERLKLDLDKYIPNPEMFGFGIKELIKKSKGKDVKTNLNEVFPGLQNIESVEISQVLSVLNRFIGQDKYKEEKREYPNSVPHNIFSPIEQALANAKLSKYEIVKTLVTGGSSRFKPIRYELKRQFSNLDELDQTFSVSDGAATFDYLVKNEKWKVIEKTTENIYLKISGLNPLLLLGKNLNIPAITEIGKDKLQGNSTIYMENSTKAFRFDFFSGVSIDDLELRHIYGENVKFKSVLPAGTILSKIVSRVDENKVYSFEFEFRKNNGTCESVKIGLLYDSVVKNLSSLEVEGFVLNNTLL